MPVRSHKNRQVVDAARLHRVQERRDRRETLIEGPHLLEEALSAGVVPSLLFALEDDQPTRELARRRGIDLVLVDDAGLARVAGTKSPRGPVGVIEIPVGQGATGRGLVVAWGVGDPGNVGTMIRTAAGFGWSFGYTEGTADPWAPKVLRAGVGAHFRTEVMIIGSLGQLETMGYEALATVVSGGLAPSDLADGKYAVLIGDEASGLPQEVVEGAVSRVTVPMPGGTESLNAAMAAGIIVYELSKYQVPSTKHRERRLPL
ncbi:MAG TPA: RNA methyltransferase [Acidimicrobiia bacterium]|nr:RNA methyltransferase [Acidimicrobiia bacterium]